MAIKRLLYFPGDEALLRRKSRPSANLKNKRLRRLIQDLKDTLESLPGAAIAAPQIGVHKRVTVVKFGQNDDDDEEPMLTLINPEILDMRTSPRPASTAVSASPTFIPGTRRVPAGFASARRAKTAPRSSAASRAWTRACSTTRSTTWTAFSFSTGCATPNELYTPVEGEGGKTKMVRLSESVGDGVMSGETVSKAALHKRLKTQPSEERIALTLRVLAAAPERLRALISGLSEAEMSTPLGAGERSFKRDLTHLIYCAERGS